MTEQNNDTQWYIARDGKQHGPLSDVEMRTFVAHSYLRTTDLLWRPGMPDWLGAPAVFPGAFQTQQAARPVPPQTQQPPPAQGYAQQAAPTAAPARHHSPYEPAHTEYDEPAATRRASPAKRIAIAATVLTLLGGGAFALATYHEPLMRMVSSGSGEGATEPPVVEAPSAETTTAAVSEEASPATDPAQAEPTAAPPETAAVPNPAPDAPPAPAPDAAASPAAETAAGNAAPDQQIAAIAPDAAPAAPPPVDGSALDAKLQTIPLWALIKKEYPEWYGGHIGEANKLSADNKSQNEIAMHLAKGLVALRRQEAEKALSASPDKLQRIAITFLDNLKALRAQSVSACYGFISTGETSPAVVQMLENPETATAFNTEAAAIFEAAAEGGKSPFKHENAVKADYDVLIKELGKLGWKDEDLQVFSNPKLLAKREPEQVCKMVQEWFLAHLSVANKDVRQRLLYETLKPVVSG